MTEDRSESIEPVDDFATRARHWLAGNMPLRAKRRDDAFSARGREEEEVARSRELQRRLAGGNLAGLLFPTKYGGQGLTVAHQAAFNREARPYELPTLFAVTLGMIGPTLLDLGTEEQKLRYLPAMIRGEEVWVQLFSEPTGGSDLAGAVTRADRDGDTWVINGSKVWTTGARFADYGLCLARTNWDVPKHQGLSVFIVPLGADGVTITPIKQLNGNADFCQEFFDDVAIPSEAVLGTVDQGWSVARQVLVHERNATGGVGLDGGLFGSAQRGREAIELAGERGQVIPSHSWRLAVDAYVLDRVQSQLRDRVAAGFRVGQLSGPAGSLLKLFAATVALRRAEINLEIAGSAGVARVAGDGSALWQTGEAYMMSRAIAIGGGTNEIQRNIIGERMLGLPREPGVDPNLPFRDVAKNALAPSPRERR